MLLAIDSGINTGWALLRTGMRPIALMAAGTARTTLDPELSLQNWADRTDAVLTDLAHQTAPWRLKVKCVAIEFPEFTKGESNKLCFMAGRTAGWAREWFGKIEQVRLIGVNEWKGQLPKSVSSERVQKRFRDNCVAAASSIKISGHTVDALGVGLYCVGIHIFS